MKYSFGHNLRLLLNQLNQHRFYTAVCVVGTAVTMAFVMVVIAAMISAGGLGEIVLKGITQMKIGLGFEGGIAVVILAIVLDRITQGMAQGKKKKL